jgi:hypothetical protein
MNGNLTPKDKYDCFIDKKHIYKFIFINNYNKLYRFCK